MSDQPAAQRVTVVIASYRWPEALRLSLQTALDQTVREIEVIVVEDGRDRSSKKVVEEFGDPRVRWMRLVRNSGSQARPNAVGRRKARAPVVAYLGHDDLWAPDHLETLLDALAREDADIAHAMTVMPGYPLTHLAGRTPATDREHAPPSSIAHLRDSPRVGEWPPDARGLLPVDYELMFRSRALGATVAATGVASVLKIPAAWSLHAFRSRDVSQHREIAASLAADPEFIARLADEAMAAGSSGNFVRPEPTVSPGELSAYGRRNRGLRSRFTRRALRWSAETQLSYPGWRDPERDSSGTFRRVDDSGRAMVRLDAPRWPLFRIEVETSPSAARGDLEGMNLDLDGQVLETRVEEADAGIVRLVADARLGLIRRPTVIDIAITDPSAGAASQARGVPVRSISVRPCLRLSR